MKKLGKYSFGTGDRFGMQGEAQLKAIIDASCYGIELDIVWNKSYREHQNIGTRPSEVRIAADEAVKALDWSGNYFVDADHINMDTVSAFIDSSDFFTIDVASYIGLAATDDAITEFMDRNSHYIGQSIAFTPEPVEITSDFLKEVSARYLYSVQKAGETYRFIEDQVGRDNFVTEVSMDEVDTAQSSIELFFILEMIAREGIPVSTIAPRFSGSFNKGIDYRGNIHRFREEFESDLMVLQKAINEFDLPSGLKLSVHSGSDKFSIYPSIGELIRKHNAGIHIKTAGTSWLEELIGLAQSGEEGLRFVKNLYLSAFNRIDTLCAPYRDVIDIDRSELPLPGMVEKWDGLFLSDALINNEGNPHYNPDLRQLLHVSYSIAAENPDEFRALVKSNREIVANCVYNNLFHRHIKLLFSGFNNY